MTAEIVDTFPHAVKEIEFTRIPLSDGVHLACRYWVPEHANERPVPAILEYIPYCTRDGTAARESDRLHETLGTLDGGFDARRARVVCRGR